MDVLVKTNLLIIIKIQKELFEEYSLNIAKSDNEH